MIIGIVGIVGIVGIMITKGFSFFHKKLVQMNTCVFKVHGIIFLLPLSNSSTASHDDMRYDAR